MVSCNTKSPIVNCYSPKSALHGDTAKIWIEYHWFNSPVQISLQKDLEIISIDTFPERYLVNIFSNKIGDNIISGEIFTKDIREKFEVQFEVLPVSGVISSPRFNYLKLNTQNPVAVAHSFCSNNDITLSIREGNAKIICKNKSQGQYYVIPYEKGDLDIWIRHSDSAIIGGTRFNVIDSLNHF
tara:strand:+ start:62 stop:613 length:552 start_codon:yes stop_codon:yes gene_type:complete